MNKKKINTFCLLFFCFFTFSMGMAAFFMNAYIKERAEKQRAEVDRPIPQTEEQKNILDNIWKKRQWIMYESEDFVKLRNKMVYPGDVVEYYLLKNDFKEAHYWFEQYDRIESRSQLTGEPSLSSQAYRQYELGLIYEAEGNLEKSLECYTKAKNMIPIYPFILSCAYVEMACEHFEKAACLFCEGIIDADKEYLHMWSEFPEKEIVLRLRLLCRHSFLNYKPFTTLSEIRKFLEKFKVSIEHDLYMKSISILDRMIIKEYDQKPVFNYGGYTQRLPVLVQPISSDQKTSESEPDSGKNGVKIERENQEPIDDQPEKR